MVSRSSLASLRPDDTVTGMIPLPLSRIQLALPCSLLALLVACGPGTAGPATLVGAAALGAVDTVVASYAGGGDMTNPDGVKTKIAIVDFLRVASTSCPYSGYDVVATLTIAMPNNQLLPGDLRLVPGFVDKYPNPTPITSPLGTLGIVGQANSSYQSLGAESGTVTLTAAASNRLQGRVTAVVSDAKGHTGNVTAEFDAPGCISLW